MDPRTRDELACDYLTAATQRMPHRGDAATQRLNGYALTNGLTAATQRMTALLTDDLTAATQRRNE